MTTHFVSILTVGSFRLVGHLRVPFGFDSGTWNYILFCCIYLSCKNLYAYNISVQLMAEENGLEVDVEGFNFAMDEARERSRNAQNKVLGFLICSPSSVHPHYRKIFFTKQRYAILSG